MEQKGYKVGGIFEIFTEEDLDPVLLEILFPMIYTSQKDVENSAFDAISAQLEQVSEDDAIICLIHNWEVVDIVRFEDHEKYKCSKIIQNFKYLISDFDEYDIEDNVFTMECIGYWIEES